jgi:hypothetical protein
MEVRHSYGEGKRMTAQKRRARRGKSAGKVQIYTLDVSFLSGPGATRLAEEKTQASRTLQLRGDQTLAELHQGICDAFGFPVEWLYEFQFGKEPMDPQGPRYVLPGAHEVSVQDGTPAAGQVDHTTLDALRLKAGRRFVYCTDDDRWQQIDVKSIEAKVPRGKYPRITRRIGEVPSGFDDRETTVEERDRPIGNSEAADAACLVGELHLSKGNFRKAIEAFTRAIEEHATADAYEGRARAFRELAAADEGAAQKLK